VPFRIIPCTKPAAWLLPCEHGLDPDQGYPIPVRATAERSFQPSGAGNLDGYLSPDPFNQRAVWEKVGFIHLLTKESVEGHPCCAYCLAASASPTEIRTPYGALFRAIAKNPPPPGRGATQYSHQAETARKFAPPIAPRNYLTQPVGVIGTVLSRRFAALGNYSSMNQPGIDFDPFPWHSMACMIS